MCSGLVCRCPLPVSGSGSGSDSHVMGGLWQEFARKRCLGLLCRVESESSAARCWFLADDHGSGLDDMIFGASIYVLDF